MQLDTSTIFEVNVLYDFYCSECNKEAMIAIIIVTNAPWCWWIVGDNLKQEISPTWCKTQNFTTSVLAICGAILCTKSGGFFWKRDRNLYLNKTEFTVLRVAHCCIHCISVSDGSSGWAINLCKRRLLDLSLCLSSWNGKKYEMQLRSRDKMFLNSQINFSCFKFWDKRISACKTFKWEDTIIYDNVYLTFQQLPE